MNRKIKFRAFLKSNKLMYDVLTLDIAESKALIEYGDMRGYAKYSEECDLMQYTGLKDINGVEIYEGDVVLEKYGPKINMIVRWIDDGFRTIGKYNSENYVGYIKESCEVIGNIYENPELLEDFKKGDSNGKRK